MSRAKRRKLAANFYPGWAYRNAPTMWVVGDFFYWTPRPQRRTFRPVVIPTGWVELGYTEE